jgi:hypothetical protein
LALVSFFCAVTPADAAVRANITMAHTFKAVRRLVMVVRPFAVAVITAPPPSVLIVACSGISILCNSAHFSHQRVVRALFR